MAEDRHPRYMKAMDRLAEAALREGSGISGDPAVSAAIKRPADQVPEGERLSKVPTPAEVRGETREREGGMKCLRKDSNAAISE